MTIKAIETRYAGCRFRSRLEATLDEIMSASDMPAGVICDVLTRGKFVAPVGPPCARALIAARSARFEHGEAG